MGLLDWFGEVNPEYGQQRTAAQAQQLALQQAKLAAAQKKAQMDAQASLLGGVNGSGQQSNPMATPASYGQLVTPANTMFSPQSSPVQGQNVAPTQQGLLDAGVQQDRIGGILGQIPTQQQYETKRQQLLRQANPDAFMQQDVNAAKIAPFKNLYSPQQISAFTLDPENSGKDMAAAAFPGEPDAIRLRKGLEKQISDAGGPQSPTAAPWVQALDQLNIPTKEFNAAESQRAFERQHTKFQEGLERYQYVPPQGLQPAMWVDKITHQVTDMQGKPMGSPGSLMPPAASAQAPPAQPPQNNAGPGQMGTAVSPQAAPQTAQAPDIAADGAPSQLAQPVEARLAQVPPYYKDLVRGVLRGAIQPPTGGAAKDQDWKIILDLASKVDPSFDEGTWLSRAAMAKNMSGTTNDSMGGRLASAKKLINHSTDLLNNGADLGTDSFAGAVGNSVGNHLSDWFGSGQQNAKLSPYMVSQEGGVGELEKLMSGAAGADAAKQRMNNALSINNPINNKVNAVGQVLDLMEGQVKPLAEQYNSTYGTNYPVEHFLGPEAASKVAALKQLVASGKTTLNTPASVKDALKQFYPSNSAKMPDRHPQSIVDELRRRGVIK